jgi:phosphatidylinositol glycan class N
MSFIHGPRLCLESELKEAHTLFYKPFAELEGHPSLQEPLRLTEIANVEQLISDGQWYNARLESAKLVQSGLAGLRYLQTYAQPCLPNHCQFLTEKSYRYNRFLIGSLVAAAYIGWAAYASLFIFKPHDVHASRGVFAVTIVAMLFVLASWTLFAIQRSPPTFYLYVIFPCYFWQQFILKAARPLRVWVQAKGRDRTYYIRLLVRAGLVMAALQSMVVCTRVSSTSSVYLISQAAYTHRSLWSGGFVLMGIAWPLFSLPKKMLLDHCLLFLSWALACLITAVFPLLGVDKKESLCAMQVLRDALLVF